MTGVVFVKYMISEQPAECSEWKKSEVKMHGLGTQREIRRAFVEVDLLDCTVALAGQVVIS